MEQARWLWVGALLFAAGCPSASRTPPPPTAAPTPYPVRTDLAGLQSLITVPRRPLAVVWQHTQIGDGVMGPTDSRLLAVMRYKPTDADAVERTARQSASAIQKGEVEILPCFPAPLRHKATRSANGNLVLRGDKLDPSAFARLSLRNGFVMRIPNSPYVVASLFTT